MNIDLYNLKNINVGDWVESSYLKGYFRVEKIKTNYRNKEDKGYLLLLKKAFTPNMRFSFSMEKCHVAWCHKLSDSKVQEIEKIFEENSNKKLKFEKLLPLYPCIQEIMFLEIDIKQINYFNKKLLILPKYFTKKQFNDFLKQENIFDYVKETSSNPKSAITLTIYTQEWMIDRNGNVLYCNPQIGNMWGKLAKLDDEKYSDF